MVQNIIRMLIFLLLFFLIMFINYLKTFKAYHQRLSIHNNILICSLCYHSSQILIFRFKEFVCMT